VILAGGIDASLAAKAATTTIRIVFISAADPVAMGLVASLNQPGANLTGSAILQTELEPKQLQLLHDLIPNAALFGVLADPASPTTQFIIARLRAAAPTLGLQLIVMSARTDSDLEPAFASFSQQLVGAESWSAVVPSSTGAPNNSRRWWPVCVPKTLSELMP
jgi:putative ABC transport system substrate-binding protein